MSKIKPAPICINSFSTYVASEIGPAPETVCPATVALAEFKKGSVK